MNQIFFTPGPTQLYPTVPGHLRTAIGKNIFSISHRGQTFKSLYAETEENLRLVLNLPDQHQILFLASATEAMERIIQGCVLKKSFHLINGAFSQRFFEIAQQLKKQPEAHQVPWGAGFESDDLVVPEVAELVCVTQNETSTGAALQADLIAALHERYPRSLLAVDLVSSVPCFDLDYSLVDAAFFSVQKGFGLPAGLGVLVVGPRCLEKANQLSNQGEATGSYHRLEVLVEKAIHQQTSETPNILGIYLLGRVCRDLLKTGIDSIRNITRQKADLLYNAIADHPDLRQFVRDPKFQSPTIAVAETGQPPARIIAKLKKSGFIIGTGYGNYRESQIRIANFPAHSLEQMGDLVSELNRI